MVHGLDLAAVAGFSVVIATFSHVFCIMSAPICIMGIVCAACTLELPSRTGVYTLVPNLWRLHQVSDAVTAGNVIIKNRMNSILYRCCCVL